MEDTYRLVIGAKFDGLHTDYLVLDTIKEKTVDSSATIATHPVQSGSSISDHLWSQPDTVSFSGTFGIVSKEAKKKEENAHKVFDDIEYKIDGEEVTAKTIKTRDEPESFIRNYIIEGISGTSSDRLTNVQETFEYIKDHGILCDLMTITESGGNVRFKQRTGMALEQITWTEKLNCMNYSFKFKEVMAIDIPTFEWSTSNIGASLQLPEAMSVSELLKGNTDELFDIILKVLVENKYILEESLKVLSMSGKLDTEMEEVVKKLRNKVIGWVATALASAYVGTAVLAGALISGAAVVPVGTIIVGVTLVAVAIFGAIALINHSKREEEKRKAKIAQEVFKLIINVGQYINNDGTIKDDAKNAEIDKEQVVKLNRFIQYAETIINKTLSDITAYSVSNTMYDDKEREVALTVGNDIYYLSFVKNDGNEKAEWQVKVLDSNEKELNGTNGIMGNNPTIHLYNLNDCGNSNYLFIGKDEKYKVYVINPNLNPDLQTENTEASIDNINKYLTGAIVIVSKGNIQTTLNKLCDAILEAAKNFDYGE